MAEPNTHESWLSVDQPIETVDQDRLNRKVFAQQLATAISNWGGRHSLTIALNGDWGSGKSSIKNMAVQTLKERAGKPATVIEFNPWRWVSQDQLAEAFFLAIGKALGERSESAASKELAKRWHKYAALFDVGANLTSGFDKVLTWGIGIAGVLTIASGSNLLGGTLRSAATAFGVGIVVIASVLLASAKTASKLAGYFDAKAESAAQTLEQAKDELSQSLIKRTAPIVVILDDVDRLTQPQTVLLFQLVKANADLPNFVYLMLFQRDIVAKSLDPIANDCGAEYLEKIVQIGLDIPKIEGSRVEKVLFEGLDAHLKVISEGDFDQVRWGNVYLGGLRQYFGNLRDVKRYLASLSFYISLFKLEAGFEVDPIDLIAIEAIRVFSPDFYSAMRNAKEMLTQTGRPTSSSEQNSYRMRLTSLLETAPEADREALRNLTNTVFPGIEWISGGATRDSGSLGLWLKQRRICSPEMFDRFFQFGIPENDLSQAEIQQIVSLAGNRVNLVKALRDLERRGLLAVLAERLEVYKDDVSLEFAIPFVTAMFDIGDLVPDDPPGTFIGPSTHIRRIVHWYLRREPDRSQRMQILSRAIQETSGLMQPLILAYDETSSKRREENPDSCLVSLEDAELLRQLSVTKIRGAANDGTLFNNQKLGSILYRWSDWGSADEAKRWASNVAISPDGALTILRSLVERGTSQSINDRVGRMTWQVSLDNLERFVLLDKFREQIDKLTQSTLSETDQNAIRAFERALKRRREGKPDRVWRDSEEDEA
jgi:predicted KAP-like P-loop ATPase